MAINEPDPRREHGRPPLGREEQKPRRSRDDGDEAHPKRPSRDLRDPTEGLDEIRAGSEEAREGDPPPRPPTETGPARGGGPQEQTRPPREPREFTRRPAGDDRGRGADADTRQAPGD